MKPFNLERALAGDPVVLEDGEPVRIAGHNPDAAYGEEVIGWVKEGDFTYSREWTVLGHSRLGDQYKLFMYEPPKQKKEGWVNLYRSGSNVWTGVSMYLSKEEAELKATPQDYVYLGTSLVTWEE